jgi:thiamine-phosphate pyrophosphorylase
MPALPKPCLMVLTDRTLLTPNWTLAQAVAPAVTGGANVVLYREADLPSTPRTSVFRFLQDGVKARVPIIVQGDPEWAVRVGADGVHLEGAGHSPAEARAIVGSDRFVGVTVTSRTDANALGSDVDYAFIHVDWTEPNQTMKLIETYWISSSVPLVVGPDVPLKHAAGCLTLGATGIAVTQAAMSAYDRTDALRRYAEVLGATH